MSDVYPLALVATGRPAPALVAADGDMVADGYVTWLAAALRSPSTRRNYREAVEDLFTFCAAHGVERLSAIPAPHIAAWVETRTRTLAPGTVKLRLAAVRSMFSYLARSGFLPANPAAEVRGPRRAVVRSATPALSPAEARRLVDAADVTTVVGLRDRALLGVMLAALVRVGAVTALRLCDIDRREGRLWLRLAEKRGLRLEVPLDRQVAGWLDAYVDAAGIAEDREGWVFRATAGRGQTLTAAPLSSRAVHYMLRRRLQDAGVDRAVGCHALRATGVTALLGAGVPLEVVQQLAGHASPETTRLYDRRGDAELLAGVDTAWL